MDNIIMYYLIGISLIGVLGFNYSILKILSIETKGL